MTRFAIAATLLMCSGAQLIVTPLFTSSHVYRVEHKALIPAQGISGITYNRRLDCPVVLSERAVMLEVDADGNVLRSVKLLNYSSTDWESLEWLGADETSDFYAFMHEGTRTLFWCDVPFSAESIDMGASEKLTIPGVTRYESIWVDLDNPTVVHCMLLKKTTYTAPPGYVRVTHDGASITVEQDPTYPITALLNKENYQVRGASFLASVSPHPIRVHQTSLGPTVIQLQEFNQFTGRAISSQLFNGTLGKAEGIAIKDASTFFVVADELLESGRPNFFRLTDQ